MADDKQTQNPFLDPATEGPPLTQAADVSSQEKSGIKPRQVSESPMGAASSSLNAASRETVASGAPQSTSARIAVERMLAPRESFLSRWWRVGVGLVCLVLLVVAGFWWWRRPAPSAAEPTAQSPQNTPQTLAPVTGAEPPTMTDDTAAYRSENFKAGEIVFLGEAEFLQADEGVAPLTLEAIRGEAFTEKNKQEVKLVITWSTNKLSKAEVGYAKGIGQTPTVAETNDFAYDHSLILSGLDPATTYLYTIKAVDRYGNIVTSEPYAVFTGARSVSLFDLIAGAIGDVFGWAVK